MCRKITTLSAWRKVLMNACSLQLACLAQIQSCDQPKIVGKRLHLKRALDLAVDESFLLSVPGIAPLWITPCTSFGHWKVWSLISGLVPARSTMIDIHSTSTRHGSLDRWIVHCFLTDYLVSTCLEQGAKQQSKIFKTHANDPYDLTDTFKPIHVAQTIAKKGDHCDWKEDWKVQLCSTMPRRHDVYQQPNTKESISTATAAPFLIAVHICNVMSNFPGAARTWKLISLPIECSQLVFLCLHISAVFVELRNTGFAMLSRNFSTGTFANSAGLCISAWWPVRIESLGRWTCRHCNAWGRSSYDTISFFGVIVLAHAP